MCNCLYKYLTDNSILYKKQFGFQKGHSTKHAIVQLVDQIRNSSESKQYTLGVFVDLTKAFDTVNHKVLISKSENYAIRGKNLLWFISYLTNQTQFIKYNNLNTSFQKILRHFLFIIYLNDLKDASKSLDSIRFTDDTIFFILIKILSLFFYAVKSELEKITQWFEANKLSINMKKTRITSFHYYILLKMKYH